ncbi:MAG: DUF3386 domain-containing protein [Chloroflexaceae bacterium]|nr:DUF3386 domain-containing protein [Chloroflexaceae bacterium]
MSETNQARDLFRAAYENRYTWDSNFPGYTADLELKQGEETYSAQVRVNSDFSVEVTEIDDEKVKESIYNQMRDIVTHRKRSSFEQAHGKNQFHLGDTDPTGAVAINVEGDAMGSNYRVRDREITQVSRVMGPMAFTINTEESLQTGAGYISVKYSAIFRDAKTDDLRGKRQFEESYVEVGGYYLPAQQIVHSLDKGGNQIATEFNFTNLALRQTVAIP